METTGVCIDRNGGEPCDIGDHKLELEPYL